MTQTWDTLRTQAHQLRGLSMDTGLPSVKRTPVELARLSDQLRHKNMRETDQSSQKFEDARYMMLQHGCDTSRLSRSLQQINLKKTFEPLDSLSVTDIQGYLRHEHELMVTTVIEEAEQNAILAFNQNFTSSVEREWQQEKRDILNSLATLPGSRMKRPVAASDPATQPAQVLGGKWGRYAEVVQRINVERLPQPVKAFYAMFEQQGNNKMLEICWKFLESLEQSKMQNGAVNYEVSVGMRFLEKQYKEYNTERGDTLEFLSRQTVMTEDVQEMHWKIIYECLLAGYGQDNEDERDNLVKYVHANTTFGFKFESQLKAYLSGKPVDANGPKERAVYRTLVQHVIARKPLAELRDDSRLGKIAMRELESRLWHTLNAFETSDPHGVSADFHDKFVTMATDHQASEEYVFYIYLLSGMFEKALEGLRTSEDLYVDSIHFGVVLSTGCLGLLKQPSLAFVQQYVKRFWRNGYFENVLHYMFLFKEERNPHAMDKMLDDITQEIPVTDFLDLFDATRMRSIGLDPDVNWLAHQTERLAKAKRNKGQLDDAVKLFDRSVHTRREQGDTVNMKRNEAEVLALLIQQITEVLKRGGENIDTLPEITQAFNLKEEYYAEVASPCELKDQFLQVWQYAEFYHWFGKHKPLESLRLLDNLEIFPTTKEGVAESLMQLRSKGDVLLHASAHLVLCAMETICRLYKDGYKEEERQQYRNRADALLMWSGDERTYVPQEIHSAILDMSTSIR